MNIFFLSLVPRRCAKYHCDKHCVKMILEACQMIWTAFHLTGEDGWEERVPKGIKIYRKTHANHPTCVWVRSSQENFKWTATFTFELCKEYTNRYGRKHACENMVTYFLKHIPKCNETRKTSAVYPSKEYPKKCTPPPLCMPEEYKGESLIRSYRRYYRGDKKSFAEWKHSPKPRWFK